MGVVIISILLFIIGILKSYELVEKNRYNYLTSIAMTTYKPYDEIKMTEIEL